MAIIFMILLQDRIHLLHQSIYSLIRPVLFSLYAFKFLFDDHFNAHRLFKEN